VAAAVVPVTFREIVGCPVRQHGTRANKRKVDHASLITSSPYKNTPCSYCGNRYNSHEKPDDWLSCVSCSKWMHEICAQQSGVIDDDGAFMCRERLV